jgi:DnaJ-class molecular chaperone
MGRRSSSGFETFVKSLFRSGTTVHRGKNIFGQRQTVVTHHDTGKKKVYTHDCGLLGNLTKSKTKNQGRITERGKVKKGLFGTKEVAAREDGTTIKREFEKGIISKDRTVTRVVGPCYRCDGTGVFASTKAPCRKCGGTGVYKKTFTKKHN